MMATKIPAPMGSPWALAQSHIFLYLKKIYIYYSLFSCVKINHCHCLKNDCPAESHN